MIEALVTGFKILLAAMVFQCIFLMLMEERLVFFPEAEGDWGYPARAGVPIEEVTIRTEDGVALHGWYFRGEGAEVTFLYFHGNAGNLAGRAGWCEALAGLPADVLVIDYRGYGKSEGRPSEEGIYRDARAAYAYLTAERGVRPEDLVLYGKSLGGGPATQLATEVPCKALVLQSTFTSIPDMAQVTYPFLPARYLARTRFDNLAKVGAVAAPVLVVHSRGDDLIPFAMGERLHAAARGPKELVLYDGHAHNDLIHDARPELLALFRRFLGLGARAAG